MSQAAWADKMGLTFPLVSDWERKALPKLGILDSDPNSIVYRYAKRAYLIVDKQGIVRYKRILDDPTQLISNDELLAELDRVNR